MPPPIALALTVLLIAYLLRHDTRERPTVSASVWIPIAWLLINGSRQISQWFGTGTQLSAQALMEGSPLDKAVYSALMLAALIVIARRRVVISEILRKNLAVVLFLSYALLSFVWSDFPLTSLKRWVKALGDLMMVLVLCSDTNPVRAISATIKRCAYVLVPLSVLFCKYYENLGRAFDSWGKASYTGVTLDKNMFGYLLFAFGLYFVASLMARRDAQHGDNKHGRSAIYIDVLLLSMIVWLLPIANSKTATLSLAAGVTVVLALRFSAVRRHFWSYAFAAILLVSVVDELFSVRGAILEASGRDATFTGRTGLWETVLSEPINPLFGAGYASFWLGERLTRFWAMYPTSPPIQAHNGYIEVYLNLGLIGLSLIAAVLLHGLRTIQKRAAVYLSSASHEERALGMFGMAYGASYLLYNVTEATFQGLNILFMIFLILAFEHRQQSAALSGLRVSPQSAARRPQFVKRVRSRLKEQRADL